ncbi:hypothetical protein ACPWR0_00720 [Pandoraea pneumonica]|uniref:hypothetical protein n=1 Tax=Pandoraea pneumonica TaxID=2508299 RepID=UPI003CE98B6F
MKWGTETNSGVTPVAPRREVRASEQGISSPLTACAMLVASALLAACAQTAPVPSPNDPPIGSVADVAPENVKVETLPAYRDTVADARNNGAVWQGSSKKTLTRVSACTAKLWKKQLPYARLDRAKAGTGQTLQLSSKDDGVLAILDLAPHKPGSEGSLYLGSTASQSLADAVRQCL